MNKLSSTARKMHYSRPWWFRIYRELVLEKSNTIAIVLSIEFINILIVSLLNSAPNTSSNNENTDLWKVLPFIIVLILTPILGMLFRRSTKTQRSKMQEDREIERFAKA